MPLRLDGPSVTDRSVLVTVLASTVPGAPGEQGAPAVAAALQVIVSGHRRSLGSRARLPGVEEEGWARAVLGPQWEALAYHQGLVPSSGGQLAKQDLAGERGTCNKTRAGKHLRALSPPFPLRDPRLGRVFGRAAPWPSQEPEPIDDEAGDVGQRAQFVGPAGHGLWGRAESR